MKVLIIGLTTLFSLSLHAKTNHFDDYKGTFVLLDGKSKKIERVNTELSKTRLSPCSTFKVPNSVFGLEANFLKGKDFTLKYDPKRNPAKKGWPKSWPKNHNLASAIENSVVWYYQEVARQIGQRRMTDFLSKAAFGNMDISGGLDKFWLRSTLKITPEEQVKFWDRLFSYKLPFKKENIDLVKDLIVVEKTPEYTLRAKTGTCFEPKGVYGAWWVGSVEKQGKAYYFATYMLGDDFSKIQKDRKRITKEYLREFGVL